jgi:hypothetical protein
MFSIIFYPPRVIRNILWTNDVFKADRPSWNFLPSCAPLRNGPMSQPQQRSSIGRLTCLTRTQTRTVRGQLGPGYEIALYRDRCRRNGTYDNTWTDGEMGKSRKPSTMSSSTIECGRRKAKKQYPSKTRDECL